MSFISPEYVIFFSVVIPAFFLIRHRFRWVLLLAVSYFFYAYGNIQYLPLIIFSTVVDYFSARFIARTDDKRQRQRWLVLSLSINLGVLFVFKYADFALSSAQTILQSLGMPTTFETLDLILPIGISFYTFQSMSYTIDVYRGKLQPEKNLGVMATFVAFFPQLVAGPIERATNLLPQFNIVQYFDIDRTIAGFQRILWGFFKKVVIADRLAIYVNAVYNDPTNHTGVTLIIATIFFGFQIYCDFSAYSDIAIGTARVMGFNLMENFRQPYFSQSVREFWARWHISLSTWFRDYVYIPLGGNRVGLWRNLVNLWVVFLISGLWHGAGWTFVIWGALHGFAVVFLAYSQARGWHILAGQGMFRVWVRTILTFTFVMFAWIFFRANTIEDAFYIVNHLWIVDLTVDIFSPMTGALLGEQLEWWLAFGLIIFLMVVDKLDAQLGIEQIFARLHWSGRWITYYALGAAIIFSGIYGNGAQQFIYFQF